MVVDDGAPVGLLGPTVAAGLDRFVQVHEAMSTDLTIVDETATPAEVFELLSTRRHRVALAVQDGKLTGLMTVKGAPCAPPCTRPPSTPTDDCAWVPR